MGLLQHPALAQPKRLLRSLYSTLPFGLAVSLARGKPDWAFFIKDRGRRLTVHDYLGSFTVVIDTSADIQRRMLSRSYEPDVLHVIERFVLTDAVCIDVGANVGAHTLPMAAKAGVKGIVHAIEPGPVFAARLRENVGLNPAIADRITIHELGLSDVDGTSHWQDSASDPGTASMHWVDRSRPMTTVTVTTLDKLVDDQGLGRLDLVKIDVDGMDHLVIQGAARSIERYHPVLIFETTLCDLEQMTAAEQITSWLVSIGYKLYRIDGRQIRPTSFPYLSMNTLALPAPEQERAVPGQR